MSFFGLFSWGSDSGKGNVQLREHLKKCAGLGERPPVFKCCDTSDPCADRTGCANIDDDDEPCPDEGCKLVPYCPKCEVPPTMTFKCPADTCPPPPKPKTKCCPRPDQGKMLCPRPKENDEAKKKRCAKKKCDGQDFSCEPRPLYFG